MAGVNRRNDKNIGTIHHELLLRVYTELKNPSLCGCELKDSMMQNVHCTIDLYYTKYYELAVTRD